jgi:hypothetical protein
MLKQVEHRLRLSDPSVDAVTSYSLTPFAAAIAKPVEHDHHRRPRPARQRVTSTP